MKATYVMRYSLPGGGVAPALQDTRGNLRTAPIVYADEDAAMRYATFAAERNPHDDPEAIVWPAIRSAMDTATPAQPATSNAVIHP